MGPLVNDKVERSDDGALLRPLTESDQEERQSSRVKSKASFAAAIALLGGVVKQFLGDSAVSDSHAASSEGRGKKLSLVVSRDETEKVAASFKAFERSGDGPSETIDAAVARHLSTPLPRATFQFNDDSSFDDINIKPRPAAAENDNDALYGFTPGIGITLGLTGQFSGPIAPRGASGHGSAGAGPTADSEAGNGGGGSTGGGPGGPDNNNSDPLPGSPPGTLENRRPEVSAPVRLQTQLMNMSVLISMSSLLAHASDPDSNELQVANPIASRGTIASYGPDTWLYTPERGDIGTVSFSYDISDGQLSVEQVASLELIKPEPISIIGTEGDDVLVGTPHVDIIDAGAGDDVVIAREDDDVIFGRSGNDRIVGGDGDDVIFAHEGDDQIFAGAGNDTVFAGEGNDIIQGDSGDDILFGEGGNDVFIATEDDGDDIIDGGDGNDTYTAIGTSAPIEVDLAQMRSIGVSTGKDTLISIENVTGGAGADHITGNEETNVLSGSGGDDVITGAGGDDELFGDDGNDTFIARLNDGNDSIDGGDGEDSYDASFSTEGVVIDLNDGLAVGSEIGTDNLISIENAIGGAGDDTLVANEDVNILTGGAGDDIFVFSTTSTGYGRGSRDKIMDFEVGDRIDIKDLDRTAAEVLEDQGFTRFTLISQGADFTEPGQIRARYDTLDQKTITVLEFNTDENYQNHEFEIELLGYYDFSDDDLYRDRDNSGPG